MKRTIPIHLVIIACALVVTPARAFAQGCDSLVTRTNLSALSGRYINSLTIKPLPPADVPAVGRIADKIHFTTRASTVKRDLLFAVGDTVDTARVGESLRRLRHRRYLSDASISAYECPSSRSIDLVIRTRDRWTTKPRLVVQSTSSLVGLEEGNLLGTGAAASVSVAVREGRVGGSLGYEDPQLFGTPLFAKIRASLYPDGGDIRGRFRNQERSVFEKIRRELILSRYSSSVHDRYGNQVQSFHREAALLTFGRRTSMSPREVNAFLFGADAERASLNAPDAAPVVGPHLVKREYVGLKAGTSRRSAAFDTLTWLVQKQVIVDVPTGIEWEAFVGGGYEKVSRRLAIYLNGWTGRMWIPHPDQLLQFDFWGTGYRIANRGNLDAASIRGQLSSYRKIKNGVASFHFAAEKLVNPDPDVRALANVDISSFLVPQHFRLAEEAMATSGQRTVHLVNIGRAFSVDGAAFVAASLRRKSPDSQSDHIGVTAIGAGIRLIPSTPGSGAFRLDVLYPVMRSNVIRPRPIIAISLAPWLESSRQREDPRLRQ